MPKPAKPARTSSPSGSTAKRRAKAPASRRPPADASARVRPGQPQSLAALVEANYEALRTIARREIVQRKLQRTTTPTSLVAETVMRLMRQREAPTSGSQICGLAAIMMTRALADRTRRSSARKRGSNRKARALDDGIERDLRTESDGDTLGATKPLRTRVLSCVEALSRDHPREMEVITLHLMLGMQVEKVAQLLGVSRRTAYRSLADGLARLRAEVGDDLLEGHA